MQVNFHEQTMMQIIKISRELGVDEENLIQRAVLFYLDAIQKQVDLKQEMNEWDMLSDEALMNFEESLYDKTIEWDNFYATSSKGVLMRYEST